MRIKYLENNVDDRVREFNKYIKERYPQLLEEKNPELFLIAGGDGAMLHRVRENITSNLPFFGKAMGTFNFLLNKFEDNEKIIQGLLEDNIPLYSFKASAIEVLLNGESIGQAVNDVIIGDSVMGYHTFWISTANGDFSNFEIRGSGLCISTTIGSTAFNYNNNGQILPLDSDLLSITGVVCNRYLNDIIPFQDVTIKGTGGMIYLSNVANHILEKSSTLTLRRGQDIEILFLNRADFLKRRNDIANRYRK